MNTYVHMYIIQFCIIYSVIKLKSEGVHANINGCLFLICLQFRVIQKINRAQTKLSLQQNVIEWRCGHAFSSGSI